MTTHRRNGNLKLVLETLEDRLALSTAAHAIHMAAPAPVHAQATTAHVSHATTVHEATSKAPAIPNPILVNLTPGATGITLTDVSFDKRVNLITIKGTVTITPEVSNPDYPYYYYPTYYPTTDYVTVSVTQAASRFRSVVGSEYANLTITDATVTKLPFKIEVLASAGEFASGTAAVTLSSSNYYNYSYSTESAIVKLRPAKAY